LYSLISFSNNKFSLLQSRAKERGGEGRERGRDSGGGAGRGTEGKGDGDEACRVGEVGGRRREGGRGRRLAERKLAGLLWDGLG
jgi:hypothetical protein